MQKVMKFSSTLLLAAAMVMAAFSIGSAQTGEINVGILLPLSGPAAPIGVNSLNGHKMAVEEINASGGIPTLDGATIKLVVADSGGDPKNGLTQAERLITQDNVVTIMGAFQSSVTYPSTQVAEKYEIPYIVPSSYKPEITERGFKYTFRLCLTTDLAGREQIEFIDRMGKLSGKTVKTLGLLYENSDWGVSSAALWKKYAEKYGFEVVMDEAYPANSATLDPVVRKIKRHKPDALLFASYTSDAILLAKGVAQQKINPMVYMGTAGGHADPVFIQNVKDASNYYFDMAETSPDIDLPIARETNAKYKKLYGEDMSDDCIKCYTATYVLAKAIEIAGTTNPKDIRRVLANIKMIPGQKGIITPYGVEFDEKGQNKHARGVFVQTLNQKRVVVYPSELALPGANIVWPTPTWQER
ncbi:ABC transporter substrate-binding protein [Desulfosarcina ovata]|uniref:Amino acid ABC transporter substrate-binding protein n=1 Tax=Desulfosarcina ovata subsp. ovata TaxID=2752305 RepID=A0A5K8A401_9BACT|nr:ABC transporter substrate-binding protein [Desulfosarcina ovata]BBO87201.1 amino acid ABC transporter substrate-binding protein [Desulfosarcina ovata subsp. ovata]